MRNAILWLALATAWTPVGCAGPAAEPRGPAAPVGRGVIAAGHPIPVTARVIRWYDPDGLNAYHAAKPHFAARGDRLSADQRRRVQRRGWTFEELSRYIDQVVIHYDAVGDSRRCFEVLQQRGLSCHFLIDLDGTIYQTLDLKERAWHATIANDRSIGIELAGLGAMPPEQFNEDQTMQRLATTPAFSARRPVVGQIHGRTLQQYDFTPQQYDALVELLAALCRAFPRMACDYPRDAAGRALTRQLSPEQFDAWRGFIGHYHIQENKVDPGPAFDWESVTRRVRQRLELGWQ